MPTQKDFKRLVRARMVKTGEAYTAARAQLLTKPQSPAPRVATPAAPASIDFAKLAGMSDAVIKAKTGCTWERWVWALDRVNAHTWPHREIAGYVRKKYQVPNWWTQTVTVGYERIKGLRVIGQRRDGGFEVSKSKTFAVSLSKLYRAFHDKRTRADWLPGVDLKVRTATRGKSMRITWPDGTAVDVAFLSKGTAKALVAVQHRKLPDKTAATKMKEYWAERLSALRDVVSAA